MFPPARGQASQGHLETLDLEQFPVSYACSITANGKVPFSKSVFTDIHLWYSPQLRTETWLFILGL